MRCAMQGTGPYADPGVGSKMAPVLLFPLILLTNDLFIDPQVERSSSKTCREAGLLEDLGT